MDRGPRRGRLRQFADNPVLRVTAEKAIKDAVRPVKVRRGVDATDLLSPADVEDLAAMADDRLALMIRFLWATGCRVSELVAVRLRDVKTNGMAAIRLTGKGNKERLVKVPVDLYAAIRETFNGKTYLFETRSGHAFNRSNIHKALKLLDSDKVRNPHAFRHSRATWLLKIGVSLTAVSALLGHSKVSITAQTYIHDAPDFEATAALDAKARKVRQ
jgi:integrase